MSIRSRAVEAAVVALSVLFVGCSDATRPLGPETEDELATPTERPGVEVLHLADEDGSEPVPLTEGAYPAWSPDGEEREQREAVALGGRADDRGPVLRQRRAAQQVEGSHRSWGPTLTESPGSGGGRLRR